MASIENIIGIGDNSTTSTEEAIKGADVVMADSHTIAYWPFNEGSGTTVTDASATYTGTINPTAMWNEGRPNATDDYSVEFDGTFTNIGTNFYLPPLPEFDFQKIWCRFHDSFFHSLIVVSICRWPQFRRSQRVHTFSLHNLSLGI